MMLHCLPWVANYLDRPLAQVGRVSYRWTLFLVMEKWVPLWIPFWCVSFQGIHRNIVDARLMT